MGVLAAAAALLTFQAAMAGDAPPQRFYDRDADCAVFAVKGVPAVAVNWDGPCVGGLASGDGTATFIDRNGGTLVIATNFRDGIPLDGKGELDWSDGAHFVGMLAGGQSNGVGVFTDRDGNRFDGHWQNGAMTGHGSIVWRNGDRFEGELVNGKAEGHGVQIWADGHKYDGPWHNDQPDGQGTVTRRDGTTFIANFVAGAMQPASAPTPPAKVEAVRPAHAAPANHVLAGFAGRTFYGVDRSSVSLAPEGGAMQVTITSPEGEVRRLLFTAFGNGMGTIADAAAPAVVTGMFRVVDSGIRAEYADGHSELIAADGDGLRLILTGGDGKTYCASWFPRGHAFSDAERQAAVAAYARRLGLNERGAPMTTCAASAPATVTPQPKPVASVAPGTPLPPPEEGMFKPSMVHAIDTEVAPVDETVASKCLKVDSDGSYWGFRNHCSYSVQFAFCLLEGNDPMTACGSDGGVAGSAPANGFGALFADNSLAERGVERKFRWVGCRGGAGEVVAHLDRADPASGRCSHTTRTLARVP
ncbi:MAG: hypothetical protein JSR60_13740 [Proteobacteria bacterium]|nr:hypothetical protein [Pseudomonadota bacterium]